MAAVWPNVHVVDASLFQCIREIRRALGDERRELLRMIARRGYVLEAAEAAETASGGNGGPRRSAAATPVIALAPLVIDQSDPLAVATAGNVLGQLTQG